VYVQYPDALHELNRAMHSTGSNGTYRHAGRYSHPGEALVLAAIGAAGLDPIEALRAE